MSTASCTVQTLKRRKKKLYTHFRSETSLPKKLMMLDVNMKLEKTVNNPAITTKKDPREK